MFESQFKKKHIRSKVERIKSLKSKLCGLKERNIVCNMDGKEPLCCRRIRPPGTGSHHGQHVKDCLMVQREVQVQNDGTDCRSKMAKLPVWFTRPSTSDIVPLGTFGRLH